MGFRDGNAHGAGPFATRQKPPRRVSPCAARLHPVVPGPGGGLVAGWRARLAGAETDVAPGRLPLPRGCGRAAVRGQEPAISSATRSAAGLASASGAGEGDQPGARRQLPAFIDLAAAADERLGFYGETGPGWGRGYGWQFSQLAQHSGEGDGLRAGVNFELIVDLAVGPLEGVEAQGQLVGGPLIRQPPWRAGPESLLSVRLRKRANESLGCHPSSSLRKARTAATNSAQAGSCLVNR
jgi:hypothetical protein